MLDHNNPDVRYTQGENSMAVARWTLAVDRRRGGEGQQADFISCTAFGKTAEFAEKYLARGTKIAITGHIQTGSYNDKNGNKVYTTDVIVEELEFAESKKDSGAAAGSAHPQAPETDENGFMNIPDGVTDELPFA